MTEEDIYEPRICASRGRNPSDPSERKVSRGTYRQRIEVGGICSNTITSVAKDSLVLLPQVLTPSRTEFGKRIRKAYECHEVQLKRQEMREWNPRTDGVSNTITSLTKDNTLMENDKIGNLPAELKGKRFRIRKLTPRECFRLMDVEDEYIDRIMSVGEDGKRYISDSKCYALAGNSIVVACMELMFTNLFLEAENEPLVEKDGQMSLF